MIDELNLKTRALELVREAFDIAVGMQRVNLSAVNRPRPPKLRYKTQADLVRDFSDRASGMLDFGS